MDYIHVGKSNLKVSRICLGSLNFGNPQWRPWVISEDECRPIIHRALELGINFFDTADMYSDGLTEEILGKILFSSEKRENIIIATKVFYPMNSGKGLSRKNIMTAVDNSLRRLNTDYIDLYQIHRWDMETPIEETLNALNDLIDIGKVRYIGASSMYAWQFCKSLFLADLNKWARFISMQNHYNLVYREEEREMIPLCQEESIGVLPWGPLARGLLAANRSRNGESKTQRAKTDSFGKDMFSKSIDFDIVDRVIDTANQYNVKPAQIALSWLLHKPGVTAPIVGVSSVSQLEDAVNSIEIKLTPENLVFLEEIYKPHPVLGFT